MYALVFVLGQYYGDKLTLTSKDRRFRSLADAAAARQISGELVVDETTGLPVDNDCWLFEWEKLDSNCFAQRAITVAKKKANLPTPEINP